MRTWIFLLTTSAVLSAAGPGFERIEFFQKSSYGPGAQKILIEGSGKVWISDFNDPAKEYKSGKVKDNVLKDLFDFVTEQKFFELDTAYRAEDSEMKGSEIRVTIKTKKQNFTVVVEDGSQAVPDRFYFIIDRIIKLSDLLPSKKTD